MKKIYSLLLLLISAVSFGQTIYTENMGIPAAATLIPAYTMGTAPATFQNGSPIVYSGTADIRASSASTRKLRRVFPKTSPSSKPRETA